MPTTTAADASASEPLDSPRTLFLNAQLVGRPAGRYSVLVQGGVIVSMSRGAILDIEDDMEIVDLELEGKQLWLSPSLVDWHTHFTMNAIASRRLDLSACTSAAQVLSTVKEALAAGTHDEGGRLVGVNLRAAGWADAADLNRTALDALSDKPLVIIFNGYHSCVCNSPALEFHDIKVHDGHDGMLLEADAFALQQRLQAVADVCITDGWVAAEAERAASFGVTEVVDLEMAHNLASWERRCGPGGFKTLRVHIGFYPAHIDDAIKAGLKTGDSVPGTHDLVTAGPLKVITDGSLGSQTAFCCDPYPGTTDRGILVYDDKAVQELAEKGHAAGLRLAVHAIGDDALHSTLTALEAAARNGCPPLPHSTIEHAQLLDAKAADVPLFKSLGLVASIQPRHLVDDRDLCHAYWPGREGRAYAFRTLHDAGIPLRLGSDCPVAPLQPWDAIACAMTRNGAGDEASAAFHPEQCIDVATAFNASTWSGRSHISEGERADIVILHSDPLACDADGIRNMVVEGTMLGGNWTYRRK
ncbi:uncharacterized protein EHS24_002394 [Apiotrichum porosum]|uniref:Amidohydrolase 3 domain-containing protein n=1 Tax=Apiotrichum porosum TaxID=105984 RepID=A0A427XIF4_9TREE|nr:uncharacterized protein EHS24_002394 [Apiotrichum porosum]RSH78665.1 hypothetical protein EHS24_002394 [Apiotrichum porosum]